MRIGRGILWVSGVALLGVVAGATPPLPSVYTARVRFQEPAMAAADLLRELSRRTGIGLECAPETCGDILLLQVQDVPLRKVMGRIAEVTDARWRPVRGAWRLERPAAWEAAERERERRKRTARIAPLLAGQIAALRRPWNAERLRNAAARRGRIAETGAIDHETDHLDPVWRALLRCLSDVPPEEIARIPSGGRVVFATDPTARQRPLGNGARKALAKLRPEQAFFGKTLRALGEKDAFEDDPDFADFPHQLWERFAPYPRTPTRALLAIENRGADTFKLFLTLLDARNRVVVKMDADDDDLPLYGPEPDRPLATGGPTIPLSPRTRALLSVAPVLVPRDQGSAYAPFVPRLSAAARALLTAPERYEPLGGAVSDGYTALAKAKKRNLIACLPDALVESYFLREGEVPLRLSDVQNWLEFGPPMRVADRDGWLIVIPPDPVAARRERTDRAALGRVVRRVAARGAYHMEDLAEFAATGGEGAEHGFGESYLWAISGGDYFCIGMGDRSSLALYGSLTDGQRRELLAGKFLPYAALTLHQRAFAEKAVYGARFNSALSGRGEPPPRIGALADEPTQVCANGLAPTMGLRAQRAQQTLIDFVESGKKTAGERIFWRMSAPAGMRAYSGPPPYVPHGGFDAVRYQVRRQMRLTLTADVTPWGQSISEYDEALQPPTGPPVPLAQLPPDIQAGVKKEIQWLRRLTNPIPMQCTVPKPRPVP